MFSTVDQPQMRFVKVFLLEGETESPLALPESEGPAFERVKADPSQEHLQWVADHLAKHGVSSLREWAVPTWALEPASQSSNASNLVEAVENDTDSKLDAHTPRLRVELWRLRFDHYTKEIVAYKHLQSIVDLDEPAGE